MPLFQEIIYEEKVIKKPKLADEIQLVIYTAMLSSFLLSIILGIILLRTDLLLFGLLGFFTSMLTGAIFTSTKRSLPNELELYLFITSFFLFIYLMLFGFIFKSWDLLIMGLITSTGVIFLYIVGFRPYINYRKSVFNPVIVSRNGIKVGNLFKAKKGEIEKSVYNVSNGFLYIYTKDGRKFKISKDPSKIYIPFYSYPVNFDHVDYGKALKKIGVSFFVVRRKGLFGVEIVKGRKAYEETHHRERYEKWLRKR